MTPQASPALAPPSSTEPAQASTQPTEVLAGSIERVTFHNAENGFCVLRIKARGHRDLVTVVGHAAEISAGEWVTVSGTWVNSREHGQQFRASFLRASAPTTAEWIEKYLGSCMIRGIGPTHDVDTLAAEPAIFLPTQLRDERHREVGRTIPWAEQRLGLELTPRQGAPTGRSSHSGPPPPPASAAR
ncbi:hypothetical protein [Synechococcus sp. CCY 0621]|uniref:YrrC family ATP-dependent DNA helicase n=1 Tax=Synechococcus sp. CCY 0621 TaxID=2815603 RepID=UPI00256FC68A|nr:hypothetical protein [Synechococcus sp. CCY 0621]